MGHCCCSQWSTRPMQPSAAQSRARLGWAVGWAGLRAVDCALWTVGWAVARNAGGGAILSLW